MGVSYETVYAPPAVTLWQDWEEKLEFLPIWVAMEVVVPCTAEWSAIIIEYVVGSTDLPDSNTLALD